ncbi:MAG: phosphotransferase family protein [Alphaproteobacteria bacterium]|nr:phosphotransferase family protein [Alphaproteobacteria bacterium]
MSGLSPEGKDRLCQCLTDAFGADSVSIEAMSILSGGAIQENWALDLTITGGDRAGTLSAVLRTDSPTGVAVSLSRAEEFALLQAAWNAGVTVPEPILCVTDLAIIGKEFCLMRRVGGTALGQRITRDMDLGGDREALTERLGREMARIHSITPETHHFDFLSAPPADAAAAELAAMCAFLDEMDRPRPVLDWTIRWLERNRPDPIGSVLAHHDFRTGNYMVDATGLTAILDWEFAGWSDRHEDIGWFHAMCWRFSGRNKPAGGVGSREAFARGYESESGVKIDPQRVYYWEVYAHLRWAVIALQQGDRYLVGGERTLDLGLTGRRPTEMELEMLRMTAPSSRGEGA